jgi:hypothetical protein
MSRVRFAFAHVSEPLNFLAGVFEPHTTKHWNEIAELKLLFGTRPRAIIEGPNQWFERPEIRRLLEHFGAESASPTDAAAEECVPVVELHRRVALTALLPGRMCKRFLVVPVSDDPRSRYDLLDALGGLRAFQARVWDVSISDAGDRHVFLLESDADAAEPPHWLPGAPLILGDYSGHWVFTPVGREHPFARNWIRLLPPGTAESPLVWLPEDGAVPIARQLKSRSLPQPIVSRLDLSVAATSRPADWCELSDAVIPLELVPGAPRPLSDDRPVAACVYRLRTARSEVGTELLRLMDLDEAGIYDLQYFNRATGPSPFSDVEHFLLQEGTALAQRDAFPHLERFDCPVALDELGIRAFFSHRCRVRPDVAQLVDHLSTGGELLQRLRQSLHLDEVADAIVLVERGPDPRSPILTLLAGGQPLREVIAPLLRAWDSVPAARALTAQFPEHDVRRESLSEAWIACGDADAAEIAGRTGEFAAWARQEIARVVAQMKGFEDRLASCAQTAADGATLVSVAPTELRGLLTDTVALIDSLAAPRRDWLVSVDDRQQMHKLAAEGADRLGVDVAARAEAARAEASRLSKQLRGRQQDLADALRRMDAIGAELLSAHADVERVLPGALQRIAEGRAAQAKLRQDIERREGDARTARAELDREADQVKEFDARVTRFESDNVELGRQIKLVKTQVQTRLQASQEEQSRLERVRDVEIPATRQAADKAAAEVEALRKLNLDEALGQLRAQHSSRQLEVTGLRETESKCDAARQQLESLQKEVKALKARRFDEKLVELGGQVLEAEAKQRGLEQEGESLHARRRELTDKLSALGTAEANFADEKRALEDSEHQCAERAANLQREQRECKTRQEDLRAETARLEAISTADLPLLRLKTVELESELTRTRDRDPEGEQSRLRHKLRELSTERDRLQQLDKQNGMISAQIEGVRAEIAALEASTRGLQSRMSELDDLRRQLAALKATDPNVMQAFESARRDLERIRRSLGVSWWKVALPPREQR